MQKASYDIIAFLLITTVLVLFLAGFVITIFYLHRKKQITFANSLNALTLQHEKTLLATQLEIQEQTFQSISREIHDNISLSLTLVKLHLRTLDWKTNLHSDEKINTSIELLTQSINDLTDISKSLNADIISQQGLIKALEFELKRIELTGLFKISFNITGSPEFMDAREELVMFRVVQEAFNNIIKHAKAQHTILNLHYDSQKLIISIIDDGIGFDPVSDITPGKRQAGLKNMEVRVKMLQGTMEIESHHGTGTTLLFTIPFINTNKIQ